MTYTVSGDAEHVYVSDETGRIVESCDSSADAEDVIRLLGKTKLRPRRCPACGGRGVRLDLDERCGHCNPCCEEHFPSEAMMPEEQAEHVCPNCSWAANPEWLDRKAATDSAVPSYSPDPASHDLGRAGDRAMRFVIENGRTFQVPHCGVCGQQLSYRRGTFWRRARYVHQANAKCSGKKS